MMIKEACVGRSDFFSKKIYSFFLISIMIISSLITSYSFNIEYSRRFHSTYISRGDYLEIYSMVTDSEGNICFTGQNDGLVFIGKMTKDCTQMISWKTWGSGFSKGIAVDKNDNLYIVGSTSSTTFPVTENAFSKTLNYSIPGPSNFDMFIIKINGTTFETEYATYIGGKNYDYAWAVNIDGNGSLYITGGAQKDFPGLPLQEPSPFNSFDAIVFKFNIETNIIEYVIKLGYQSNSMGLDLKIDDHKNCYVTGYGTDRLYATKDAYDTSFNGGNSDAFIAKLDQDGKINYLTYIGGSGADEGHSIDIDIEGCAYITGKAEAGESMTSNFPTTLGSYLNKLDTGTSTSAFLLKLDKYGSSLNYSTFLRGREGNGLILDRNHNAHVTGRGFNVEVTYGALQTKGDAFIMCINEIGDSLVYSTYFGGSGEDRVFDIELMGDEMEVGTVGWTKSTDFPLSPDACYQEILGDRSGFVFVLNLTIIPFPPQDLMIGYGEGGGYELNWNEPRNDGGSTVLGYRLYRSEGDGNFVVIADLLENLTYTDRTVDLGKVYRYYVTAYNIMGESLPSNIVTNLDMSPPELIEDLTSGRAYTGDPFEFNVRARDDWYLKGVNVIYSHGSYLGRNISMENRENDTWSAEVRVSDDLLPIEYMFYAYDLQGNSILSVNRTIEVMDNDEPYLKEDLSDRVGTTGDGFELKAKVEDNIEVGYCSFFYSLNEWKEVELEGIMDDEGNWIGEIFLPIDVIGKLRYTIGMEDTSKNKNRTGPFEVEVVDNDAPEIVGDHTNKEGMMGRTLRFKVEVRDNIGVEGVRVFVEPEGKNRTIELKKSLQGLWEGDLELPKDEWTIGYRIEAKDTTGNINVTEMKYVLMKDGTSPVLMVDLSDREGTTGDPFRFGTEVSDNIGVSSVRVNYWFTLGDRSMVELEESGGKYWNVVDLPHNKTGILRYNIEVTDTSGNRLTTPEFRAEVRDNDGPVVEVVWVGSKVGTGEVLVVEYEALDNIGIGQVRVKYRMNEGENVTEVIIGNDRGEWSHRVVEDEIGVLQVWFEAEDLEGNVGVSSEGQIEVEDIIPPVVMMVENITVKVGKSLMIELNASDNIGIERVIWSGLPIGSNGTVAEGKIGRPGEYHVVVTVLDGADNQVEIEFTIIVEEEEGKGPLGYIVLVMLMVLLLLIGVLFLRKRKWSGKNDGDRP